MSGEESQNHYDHDAQSPYRCATERSRVLSPTIGPQRSVTGIAKHGAERYNINKANRGTCVIIKNDVTRPQCFPELKGYDDDVRRIAETFRKLHFDIVPLYDLKRNDIRRKIRELQKDEDVSKRDCLCIFVLTCGFPNDFLMAEDGLYISSDIWRPFTAEKCQGLAGKPKLFFVQAPMGYDLVSGDHFGDHSDHADGASSFVPPTEPMLVDDNEEETDNAFVKWAPIPANADFMTGHCSANKLISRSDSMNKKPVSYVTILCDVLDEYSESMDILKISTMTAQRIRDIQSQYNMENLPVITSTLRKEIYLSTNESNLQGGNIECYATSSKKRSKCLVFNHETFQDKDLEPRQGTEADVHRIQTTFYKLGFDVHVCMDYTYAEIICEIKKSSSEDYTDINCLCIFVLTRGDKGGELRAWDLQYKLTDIWKKFVADKCPTLKGKPKLFFIQACRGDDAAAAANRWDSSNMSNSSQHNPMNLFGIPTHADFLFAHSCVHEYFSLRDTHTGSWFVPALCDVLEEYSDSVDLLGMLTITAQKIASKRGLKPGKQEAESLVDFDKQASSISSTLTKAVYLRKIEPCI